MASGTLFYVAVVVLWLTSEVTAKRCYFCKETCDQGLIEYDCEKEWNGQVEADCYDIQVVLKGKLLKKEKGCLPTTIASRMCDTAQETEGVTCRVCNGDLCNSALSLTGNVMFLVLLTYIFLVV